MKKRKKSTNNPAKKRDKQGRFIKGKSGNPAGRPLGSLNHNGLNEVLNMFRDLVAKKDNLKKIEEGLQRALDKNPVGFYYRFVMPLYPKNVDIGIPDGVATTVNVYVTKLKEQKKNKNANNRKGKG